MVWISKLLPSLVLQAIHHIFKGNILCRSQTPLLIWTECYRLDVGLGASGKLLLFAPWWPPCLWEHHAVCHGIVITDVVPFDSQKPENLSFAGGTFPVMVHYKLCTSLWYFHQDMNNHSFVEETTNTSSASDWTLHTLLFSLTLPSDYREPQARPPYRRQS